MIVDFSLEKNNLACICETDRGMHLIKVLYYTFKCNKANV